MHISPAALVLAVLAAQPAFSIPIIASGPPGSVLNTHTPVPVVSTNPFLNALREKLRLTVSEAREVNDLMQREEFVDLARDFEDLLARADEDGSEAISFSKIPFKKIGKVGGILLDGFNILSGLLPSGNSSPPPPPQPSQSAAPAPQQRDSQDLEARGLKLPFKQLGPGPFLGPFFGPGPVIFHPASSTVQPTPTPTPQVVGSLPIFHRELEDRNILPSKLRLGPGGVLFPQRPPVAIPTGIALSRLLPAAAGTPATGFSPVLQRELVEILRRQLEDDESGASLISTVSKVFNKVKGVFNDADKLEKVASGTSIVSDVVSAFSGLRGNNQAPPPPPPVQSPAPSQAPGQVPQQPREVLDIFERAIANVGRELNELD